MTRSARFALGALLLLTAGLTAATASRHPPRRSPGSRCHLDVADSALLFAMTNLAAADASINCCSPPASSEKEER